jgi:aspartate aminotransferase-like enzyme
VAVAHEIRQAMAAEAAHPLQPEFSRLIQEVRSGLAELAGLPGQPAILTGARETAMDAAVSALFSPKEPVIVIETGEVGEAWARAAEARGLDSILYRIPVSEPLTADRLKQAVEMEPEAKGVLMAAADASTGVEHPVAELAGAARDAGMLSVFEASSLIGVSRCRMQDWGADCLVAGLDAGLGLPPGLCMAAASGKARERMADVAPASSSLDLHAEFTAIEGGRVSRFSPPSGMLSGLHAALALTNARGAEVAYAERRALAAMCRAGVWAMGLSPAVNQDFAASATAVSLPDGMNARDLLAVMAEGYGVMCSPGAGPAGRTLVMGHMGDVDHGDVLAGLAALAAAFSAAGGEIANKDYLERSVQAFETQIVESLGQSG